MVELPIGTPNNASMPNRRRCSKASNGNFRQGGFGLAIALNLVQRFQGLRGQVAAATVRAADHGHVFNDEQGFAFAVGAGDVADFGRRESADITRSQGFRAHRP
jgi:hypothetical protein